ncbi:MAG: hypothetical protein HY719_04525 [Planctomycetes bacterium]|nr:hypothetical protein [Planctomycetota bacterium]
MDTRFSRLLLAAPMLLALLIGLVLLLNRSPENSAADSPARQPPAPAPATPVAPPASPPVVASADDERPTWPRISAGAVRRVEVVHGAPLLLLERDAPDGDEPEAPGDWFRLPLSPEEESFPADPRETAALIGRIARLDPDAAPAEGWPEGYGLPSPYEPRVALLGANGARLVEFTVGRATGPKANVLVTGRRRAWRLPAADVEAILAAARDRQRFLRGGGRLAVGVDEAGVVLAGVLHGDGTSIRLSREAMTATGRPGPWESPDGRVRDPAAARDLVRRVLGLTILSPRSCAAATEAGLSAPWASVSLETAGRDLLLYEFGKATAEGVHVRLTTTPPPGGGEARVDCGVAALDDARAVLPRPEEVLEGEREADGPPPTPGTGARATLSAPPSESVARAGQPVRPARRLSYQESDEAGEFRAVR